jgi:hypothetical protein
VLHGESFYSTWCLFYCSVDVTYFYLMLEAQRPCEISGSHSGKYEDDCLLGDYLDDGGGRHL